MPELPVVQPAGPVSLGGNAPSIPKTSPVLETLGATKFEDQIFSLIKGIRLQKQKQNNAQAIIDYTDKVNKLYNGLQTEPDLDKRLVSFQTGLGKIKEGLVKDTPNLSTSTVQSIADRISNDYKTYLAKITEEKYKHAVHDFNKYLDDAVRQVPLIDDKHQRATFDLGVLKHIHDTMMGGFISKDEASDAVHKYIYDSRKAVFQRLSEEHPEQALKLNITDVPLNPNDFYAIKGKAWSIIAGKQDMATAQGVKMLTNLRIQKALKEEAEDSPASRNFVDSSLIELSNFRGRPEDLDKYYLNTIAPHLYNVNQEGRYMIIHTLSERKAELRNDFSNTVDENMDTLTSLIMDKMSDFKMNFPLYKTKAGQFNHTILQQARHQMKEAKTIGDVIHTTDEIKMKIDDYYDNIDKHVFGGTEKPKKEEKPTTP